MAEGIRRLRLGQVERRPGFDGEYGAISLLAPAEIQRLSGQVSLFGAEETPKQGEKKRGQLPKRPKAAEREGEQGLQRSNPQQQAAISAEERTVAVVGRTWHRQDQDPGGPNRVAGGGVGGPAGGDHCGDLHQPGQPLRCASGWRSAWGGGPPPA